MSVKAPQQGESVARDHDLEERVRELTAANEKLQADLAERRRIDAATRRQREMLEAIFDHIPVMIAYSGTSGRLELVNHEIERTLGWSLAEIRLGNVDIYAECYPDPRDRERVLDFIAAADGRWTEFRTRTRDGRVLETLWARVKLSDGASIGFGQDVTERRRALDDLRRSEGYLNESQRLSHHGSWAWDARTRSFTYWSRESFRMFGFDPDGDPDVMHRAIELVHPEDRAIIEASVETSLQRRQDAQLDFRIVLPGNSVRYIRSIGNRVLDDSGELAGFAGTWVDCTESKAVESMQRSFSRQLVRAQEAERRHIARELHDEIGQALTAIKLELRSIEQAWTGSSLSLAESIAIADRTMQQVRDLSLDLRPSLLDDFGLYPALRWYLNRHTQRAGLHLHLTGAGNGPRLPVDLETVCFRVAQEALTNIMRHAAATNVWVELRRRGRRFYMTIRDDGAGFDVEAAREAAVRGGSMGLLGMQERVRLVGGRMKLTSSAGGTELRISLPIADDDPPATGL